MTRVKADVREPTQRQLLVDIVRPMNYSPIPSRRTVKEAKRRLKTENVPGAGSVVQHEREKALCVTKARPTRPPPPLWGSEANRPIAGAYTVGKKITGSS